MTTTECIVIDLCAASGGVVHRSLLAEAGITAKQVHRMVRTGLLARAAPHVLVLRGTPDDWERDLRVAVLEAGPGAVVSHAAAAVLWELPQIGRGTPEVTVPRRAGRPRRTVGIVHHTLLPSSPVADRATGLPVTGPERTILDLSGRLRRTHLARCVQDLCRRELTSLDALAAALAGWRASGRRGVLALEAVLDDALALPPTDSWLEARFVELVVRNGMQAPETQVLLEAAGRRYRVDAFFRARLLVVELLGHASHATREQLRRDAERVARLQAAGFEVVSFTYDQVVHDPSFVVEQVRRRIGQLA